MENCTQISFTEWQQWKQEIKDRLNQTVENFIAIGYRLRQIQDTEAYRNEGYTSVYEFAQKEFSLSDSTTNRFMAINAKFTIDGNGQELLPEFKGISYSKLQEMLTLSDEDCKLITVNTTVKEIRELKNFNHDDENKYIKPEGQQSKRTPLQECIWDFFSQVGNKGLLEEIIEALTSPDYCESMAAAIADAISPAGNRTHRKGIVYLFMHDYDRGVSYKLMTSPMPIKTTWREFLEEVRETYADYMVFEGSIWEAAYGSVPAEESESQIPGQMDITQLADVGNDKSVKSEKSKIATSQEVQSKKNVELPKIPQLAKGGSVETDTKCSETPENITENSEIVSELPTDVSKMAESVIKTECENVSEDADMAAGVTDPEESDMAAGMEETDWSKLWYDTSMLVNNLDLFFDDFYDADDLVENRIPKEDLEKHYNNAVAVAAAIERMLNGKKYTT